MKRGFSFFRCVEDSDGFTLMEVLIAITLSAVILSIVASAVSIGRNAWEKGDEAIKRDLFRRWLETSIRRQLCSLDFRNYENFNTSFKWTESEMTFLSCVSVTGGDVSAVYFVRYYFERNSNSDTFSLFLEEEPISEKVIFQSNDKPPLKTADKKTICDSAEQIVFSYIKINPKGQYNEISNWTDKEPPDLVRILIKNLDAKDIDLVFRPNSMNAK